MGQLGQQLLSASEKVWKLGSDEKLSLCSNNNAPAIFLNLQIACWKRDILQTRCPLWSTVSLSVL